MLWQNSMHTPLWCGATTTGCHTTKPAGFCCGPTCEVGVLRQTAKAPNQGCPGNGMVTGLWSSRANDQWPRKLCFRWPCANRYDGPSGPKYRLGLEKRLWEPGASSKPTTAGFLPPATNHLLPAASTAAGDSPAASGCLSTTSIQTASCIRAAVDIPPAHNRLLVVPTKPSAIPTT